MDPDIRDREMRLWQTLGPARYRLRSAGLAVLVAFAGVVIFLGIVTLVSFFPGSGTVYQGPGERPVSVVVGECEQIGPISKNGFGYWWECNAIVTAADGAARQARLERSIVTPEDRGQPVELREGCRDKSGLTDCGYGRPVNEWFEVGVLLIGKLNWVIAVVSALGVLMYLTRALLGAPRYCRFRGSRPLSERS
ncbi:DUF6346 domain-containing protein [Micromonospora sp. NPDC048835]|uniref:DUF6346 domain-containing protein n=1 Tax=Micromonospora sp. NPDC048835 TaxID=3155147 RepID=UPI0033E3AF35